jgi:hypothetical protein
MLDIGLEVYAANDIVLLKRLLFHVYWCEHCELFHM